MHILLVEPNYYSRFPPYPLLKLSAHHKKLGDTTELVRGEVIPRRKPNLVYITSLFTYAWIPVHNAVKFYKKLYPKTKIILGGIYASIMPEHAIKSGADEIFEGRKEEVENENLMPDYSLIPEWNGSIVFTMRGCKFSCNFCAVPKLEGKPKDFKKSVKSLIYPKHTKVIFWDNNFFVSPHWQDILEELRELKIEVDFNQGLDSRLITDKVAKNLKQLKIKLIRLAYDTKSRRKYIERAIKILSENGIDTRSKVIVYTLYNFEDTPQDFFERIKDLLEWRTSSYPMRFQSLNSLKKNEYISKNWSKEELEMVARSRRVLGYSGALPPYDGLVKKFQKAKNFQEAFSLRDSSKESKWNKKVRWVGLDWRKFK